MKFGCEATLDYAIQGDSSLVTSIKCLRAGAQEVVEEKLQASRPVNFQDFEVGLVEGSFTRVSVQGANDLQLRYQAEVEVKHQIVEVSELGPLQLASLPATVLPFLFPSVYCPSFKLQQVAKDFCPSTASPYEQVRAVLDWIYQHLTYQSGVSDVTHGAVDTLLARAGVCRDFAHLAIGLLRARSIPARYVTVYAHQLYPQDFHACFEAWLGDRWCLFDATRLAPVNGLIKIASGRDAADVAVANIFGDVGQSQFSVEVTCADNSFEPLTQTDLFGQGKVLSI